MDESRVRERLLAERAELEEEETRSAEGRRTVELDQQSVGRLSRMDALQNQAMARAQSGRREARRARIDAALKRLDAGEYGYCVDCGEELAPKRLEADPTLPRCLDCMSG